MNPPTILLKQCPVCFSDLLTDVILFKQVPIFYNVLWTDRSSAIQVPRGDIQLCFCQNCGHIFNQKYEPDQLEYSQNYENSLHFSPHFQQYVTDLASHLVEKYHLSGKNIIEIGSGQGDFLNLLCEKGGNQGAGFDPSYIAGPEKEQNGVTFIQDYYSEKYASYPADFICCRQVLEHIYQPSLFLKMLRGVINDRADTIVFFEVPNAAFTISCLGIWDILYEHFSYFNHTSLTRAFSQNGFQVLNITPTFGDQFLTIEARPVTSPSYGSVENENPNQFAEEVSQFAENFRQKTHFWQQRLDQFKAEEKKAVIWGAGTKGISFLNNLNTTNVIDFVVDINPRKKGMFITGTGQEIIPPQFLKTIQPDFIIIMNANYTAEIQQQMRQIVINAQILSA